MFPRTGGEGGRPWACGRPFQPPPPQGVETPWAHERGAVRARGASVCDLCSFLDGQPGSARVRRAAITFYRGASPQPEPCVESEREPPLSLSPPATAGKSPAPGCISVTGHAHTHTCMHTHTCVYTCDAHTHLHTRAHIHVQTHAHMCTHMHTHAHICVYRCLWSLGLHLGACSRGTCWLS